MTPRDLTDPGNNQRDEEQQGTFGVTPRGRSCLVGDFIPVGGSAITCRSRRYALRGRGTNLHRDAVRVIAMHPVAVIITKRSLGIITDHCGWLAADLDFGSLATDERILDDGECWCLGETSEFLALLEDLFPGPYIDCECNEYDHPKGRLTWGLRGL